MKSALLFLIAFYFCFGLQGQSIKWDFSSPVLLDPTINSSSEEIMPVLSSDFKTMYFVRSFHPDNTGGNNAGQDIWYSKKNSTGRWSSCHNDLLKFNNADHNAVIGWGKQGIYVLTAYHGSYQRNISITYAQKKNNDDWHMPQKLLIKGIEPKGKFLGFYMHPSEKVLMVSMEGKHSKGREDLYVILLNQRGKWSEPIHLGDMINTKSSDFSPFLAKDKKTLFFSSDGFSDSQNADIYYSIRLDNSWKKWSEPKKVKNINSEAFDAYFYLSEDSKEAFFASNRQQEFSDIFTTKLLKLDEEIEQEVFTDNTGNTNTDKEIQDKAELVKDPEELQNVLVFTKKGNAYVYFDFASDQLSSRMENMLDYLVKELIQKQAFKLRVLDMPMIWAQNNII